VEDAIPGVESGDQCCEWKAQNKTLLEDEPAGDWEDSDCVYRIDLQPDAPRLGADGWQLVSTLQESSYLVKAGDRLGDKPMAILQQQNLL
jgi:hypothetical protein